MQIEVIIVAVIVFGIMTITGQISMNQLISDNQLLFLKIKEKDWDFLVRAKYGTNVNPDILFNKRIKNALITMAIAFAIMIKDLNAVKVLLIFVLGIFVFKSSYNDNQKILSKTYGTDRFYVTTLFKELRNSNSTLYCTSSNR